ncbi:MAG TPA: NAD(P)-dependent oxidoreductase [Chryseosolibacter sp.]|nr:NAD(P)-dependent oxidoreductase [Chryseosolibacter sp.]
MKILVTGSNGLLGQKLTFLLQEESNVEFLATARGTSALSLPAGMFQSMDICDRQQVLSVVKGFKPDVIIHAAAMTLVDKCELDQDACWKANVTAVENIIEGCQAVGAHLVFVSTDFIFDGSHGPLDETAEPGPVNFYGVSKLEGERLVMRSGLDWCIARTVLVYGTTPDMSRSNIVLWVKESLERGKNIQVVNDQWRTPTLAEDLAAGCFLAARKRAKGIYNISGKDFMTPLDIATRTADFFDLDSTLIKPVDSTTFKQPARRPLKTGFIIDKARKELGYQPHSFEEGLAILAQQLTRPVIT